jgi:leukotriene-A4 hydrolase
MPSKDPHSCWSSETAQIKHVELDLTIDFGQHILTGHAVYEFDRPVDPTVKFDTRGLRVSKVTSLNGAARKGNWTLDSETFLGQVLNISGLEGATKIRIDYETSPEAAALQWLDPAQTAGKKHPYMFSQCQAILARSVFPCHDTPAVRFTYNATLRVPMGLTAVMAAESKGSTQEDGKSVFRFQMRHPIPSYLMALAAGNIVSEPIGKRSRVFAEPEVVKGAAWEFAEVDGIIDSAERLFGDYIWDEFNLLVMPPSFPYGGMENPTLTFLTPTLIAGDRSLVSVVAHELAHSWTGNLVTNATWEDFWLNEGWTVYAERRIIEQMHGTELANLQAVNGRNDLRSSFDNFKDQPEYTKLKTKLDGVDPDEVFSSVPYEKGYLFLVEIERAVGREVFDRFIRTYIDNCRFTSMTTEQFVDFLTRELPDAVRKVDVKGWIYEAGLPKTAPEFTSKLIDEVRAVKARWDKGDRDLKETLTRWNVDQKVLFLDELFARMTPEECAAVEKAFDIGKTGNFEILLPWYCIAAASGYSTTYPAIRDFLGVVGRGKYLKPLYRALHKNPETKALARELFDEFKDRYHSVARSAVQRILES